ncbi:MAG: acyl carrier protein [Rhizobiales bacterium]|nr:acyl carrier protein [Hyphomicrobiales bacterium]
MTAKDIESKTRKVLIERFPEAAALHPDSLAMENVAEWDSMAQVEVVVALELLFGIEADTRLVEARSLCELAAAVETLLEGAATPVS